MLAVKGIYHNGKVIINEKIETLKPVSVIVTFPDNISVPSEAKFNLDKFSFKKSRKILEDYKGKLSDAIMEERRSFL